MALGTPLAVLIFSYARQLETTLGLNGGTTRRMFVIATATQCVRWRTYTLSF